MSHFSCSVSLLSLHVHYNMTLDLNSNVVFGPVNKPKTAEHFIEKNEISQRIQWARLDPLVGQVLACGSFI